MAHWPAWAQLAAVLLTFLIGLRLSAFFSGSETGFYRLSLPRLGIDAQAGDRVAKRLLWFAQRPGYFVATTLVGNNVANYLITVAITELTILTVGRGIETAEIVATLLFSPVIFLLGELLPKSVYYRAPLARMRPESGFFYACYLLALPATAPLVTLTRAIERLSGATTRAQELLPGRGRFLQMIGHGHKEGLLTQVQSHIATGVLRFATERVTESMTPAQRVLGLPASATAPEMLTFARRFGTPVVNLHGATTGVEPDRHAWESYVRVGDLATRSRTIQSLRQTMPRIPSSSTKLEALALLHEKSATHGAVIDPRGQVVGTISQRGLTEQLFRPPLHLSRTPPHTGGLPADR